MRARSQVEVDVLASDDYYTQRQMFIGDAPGEAIYEPSTYLGYDPFQSGTINADLEQPLVQADFELHLGRGVNSLSPYMTGGMLVAGRPLFDPGRYLTFKTRTVGRYAGAPADHQMPWRPVFTGRIDTSDPSDGDTLSVHCRDWYCDWLDRWIEPEPERGSWTINAGDPASIFAQLMTLFLTGWTGPPGAPVLTIIGSPNMAIPAYTQDAGSGLLAMRSAALLNGWDFRGRFNATDQWVLTYNAPDRALAGAITEFGPRREIAFRGLPKSRDEVRNRVRVVPADPPRDAQITEDLPSQLKYGLKFLGVAEDIASRIRTPPQALALALAIKADTKEPKTSAVIDLNYQPLVEVNDVFRFLANFVQTDHDMVLAASGYTHQFTADGAALTTLNTRDLPAAANAEWRAGEQLMAYTSTQRPTGVAKEGATWTKYSET